jgi:Tol biopolymer transport system component
MNQGQKLLQLSFSCSMLFLLLLNVPLLADNKKNQNDDINSEAVADDKVVTPIPALPDHNIVMFNLSLTKGEMSLSKAEAVAIMPGYDNQPHFSPDGQTLYFTRIEDNNADMWQWSFANKSAGPVVEDPLSEYSPTVMPNSQGAISTVRVEADGTQRLWQYHKDSGFRLLFKHIQPVGYHVWQQNNLAMFILAKPHELHISQLNSEEPSVKIDSNIGRCLQMVPQTKKISYSKIIDQQHFLHSYDFSRKKIEKLIALPAEDYVWFDQNTIISSKDEQLVYINLGDKNPEWQRINNSSKVRLHDISRLALSADRSKIAVVVVPKA